MGKKKNNGFNLSVPPFRVGNTCTSWVGRAASIQQHQQGRVRWLVQTVMLAPMRRGIVLTSVITLISVTGVKPHFCKSEPRGWG